MATRLYNTAQAEVCCPDCGSMFRQVFRHADHFTTGEIMIYGCGRQIRRSLVGTTVVLQECETNKIVFNHSTYSFMTKRERDKL
jgi:hypothetical protein